MTSYISDIAYELINDSSTFIDKFEERRSIAYINNGTEQGTGGGEAVIKETERDDNNYSD